MTIKCPYCGKTVIMDWHCEKCGNKIEYDIKYDADYKLIRSNPHKAKCQAEFEKSLEVKYGKL